MSFNYQEFIKEQSKLINESLNDRKKIEIDATNKCVNGYNNNQRSKGFIYSVKSILDNKIVYVIDSITTL